MAFIRRTITLIALLASSSLNGQHNSVQAAQYANGMNSGMALRLEQKTIESFKKAMQSFLPHYIEADIKLPKTYQYNVGFLFDFLTWTVNWKNIEYGVGTFDFQDIKFDLVSSFAEPMMKIDFPAFKEWKISADQSINTWMLPESSKVTLEFHDFDFDINCQLKCTDMGYLKPVVYSAKINFGESYLYHDNQFVSVVMHQIVEFGIVIIENSVYFVGDYIFTNMAGPVLTTFLNDYKLPLPTMPSPFHGQNTQADFLLDYRQTIDPNIGDGYLDTYFLGELIWADDEMGCAYDHDFFDFMDATTFSQLVVSETAMTCMLNNIAKTPIGHLDFSEKKINEFFQVDDVKLDTTSFAKHMPIFKQKVGPNKMLKLNVSYKDINVMLGQFDVDAIIEYTLCISFSLDDSKQKELLYDELKMVTSFNVKVDNDVAFITILNNKLDLPKKNTKKEPIRNSMKLTNNEYREFLSTFGFTMNFMKKWMNDVTLRGGVKLPYNMEEIYTSVDFSTKAAHIFLEVEDKADKALERGFWDDAYKAISY